MNDGGNTPGAKPGAFAPPQHFTAPAFVRTPQGTWAVAGINTFATPFNSAEVLGYRFGQGGGGIWLAVPRFLDWLEEASGGAVRPPRQFMAAS